MKARFVSNDHPIPNIVIEAETHEERLLLRLFATIDGQSSMRRLGIGATTISGDDGMYKSMLLEWKPSL